MPTECFKSLLLLACVTGVAHSATAPARLPDWSGYWALTGPTNEDSLTPGGSRPRPEELLAFLRPDAREQYATTIREKSFEVPWSSCDPAGVPAMMTEIPLVFEWILRPDRVTLLMQDGEYRQIHTDGRSHSNPDEVFLTNFGESIGHWERDTLVVSTIGLRDDNNISIGLKAPGMHVDERIRKVGPRRLEDVITVSGPEFLTKPFSRTRYYAKVDAEPEEFLCVASRNVNDGKHLRVEKSAK